MSIPALHREYYGPLLPTPENEILVGTITLTPEMDICFTLDRGFTEKLSQGEARNIALAFSDYLTRELHR